MNVPIVFVWLGSWLLVALVMGWLWNVQRRTGNAGMVDVAWSFGTALVGIAFCVFGDGDPTRRALLGAMIGIWGTRLGSYLWKRVTSEPEDGRYAAIREMAGENQHRWLFLFFQIQALWALLFASPIFFAARNATEGLGLADGFGVAIWLIAIGGETIADRQLARFRRDPANRGQVCRDGLWAWSRHPNYFFEWIHWFAYVVIGWNAPYGAWTLLGPALMLFFFFKVTGIPPTEAQALRSRGDAYRKYQREVSVFVPWPPKHEEVDADSASAAANGPVAR